MTSSDSDSLPRNKEWFFSRNRLNVAISRAQVASIILFNPKLLDKTLESALLYFQDSEEYEKCAHIFKIQQILKESKR